MRVSYLTKNGLKAMKIAVKSHHLLIQMKMINQVIVKMKFKKAKAMNKMKVK